MIKLKANTTDGLELLIHIDFRKDNLVFEQVDEGVTYFKYNGRDGNGSAGEYYLLTETIDEI